MNTFLIVASLLLLYILAQWNRSNRAKKILCIIDNNCIGCQRCLKKCHHKALEMVDDDTGKHVTMKYPEKCTACGDCVAGCKFKALRLVNREQP